MAFVTILCTISVSVVVLFFPFVILAFRLFLVIFRTQIMRKSALKIDTRWLDAREWRWIALYVVSKCGSEWVRQIKICNVQTRRNTRIAIVKAKTDDLRKLILLSLLSISLNFRWVSSFNGTTQFILSRLFISHAISMSQIPKKTHYYWKY